VDGYVEIDLLAPSQRRRGDRQGRGDRASGGRVEQFGVEHEAAEIEPDAGHSRSFSCCCPPHRDDLATAQLFSPRDTMPALTHARPPRYNPSGTGRGAGTMLA